MYQIRTYGRTKKYVARNIYSLAEAYVALTNGDFIPMPYAIYDDENVYQNIIFYDILITFGWINIVRNCRLL